MKLAIALLTLLSVAPADDWKATLSKNDVSGPLPTTLRVDSLYPIFGMPMNINHTTDFCGKGPKIVNNTIVEGDSIYCDSVVIYTLDSLTICTDDNRGVEYYVFTSSRLVTTRGIGVGQSKQKVLAVYGKPSKHDEVYVFSERLNGEDDSLQYVCVDSPMGIAFFFSHETLVRIYIGRGAAC